MTGVAVESVVPERFRHVFPFREFNSVQAGSLKAFESDENMVVSAPTGSGKTTIFEMAICRLIDRKDLLPSEFNIVYLAPIKALCTEKAEEWKPKFSALGLEVGEVTGDMSSESQILNNLDIICTTPEKWDSVTRSRGDGRVPGNEIDLFFQFGIASKTALLIVDEVHNIGDDRGGTLEAVVSRMRLTQTLLKLARSTMAAATSLRVIAASATIPNFADIQEWLKPAVATSFDASVRPCNLSTHVLGYHEGRNPFLFEKHLNDRLPEVIWRYGSGRPSLVFCPSRKSSMNTAMDLAKVGPVVVLSPEQRSKLQVCAMTCTDPILRKTLPAGVAFHNASLGMEERRLVEDLFKKTTLPILCTTTTLAQGVNLPAHLVVIKSTQVYRNGCVAEYDSNTITQMIGRAGRPQYDESGVAVVMTRTQTKELYELAVTGAYKAVESQLRDSFIEHVNAEVCRGTIVDVPGALLWLKETFFWVRIKNNTHHYFRDVLDENLKESDIEQLLKKMCIDALHELQETGLACFDEDGLMVSGTGAAKIMARHYVRFETMKQLRRAFQSITLNDLLRAIAESSEFSDVALRRTEKKPLNEMNRSNFIQLPKKERVKTSAEKVFVLIQASLADSEILSGNSALRLEATRIMQSASRVVKCARAFMEFDSSLASYNALLACSTLLRCLETKTALSGQNVLKQLRGVGSSMLNQLQQAGIVTFDDLRKEHPRRVESILHRNPPFGNQLLERLAAVPKLELSYNLEEDCVAVEALSRTTSSTFVNCFLLFGIENGTGCKYERMRLQGDRPWVRRIPFVAGSTLSVCLGLESLFGQDKQVRIQAPLVEIKGVSLRKRLRDLQSGRRKCSGQTKVCFSQNRSPSDANAVAARLAIFLSGYYLSFKLTQIPFPTTYSQIPDHIGPAFQEEGLTGRNNREATSRSLDQRNLSPLQTQGQANHTPIRPKKSDELLKHNSLPSTMQTMAVSSPKPHLTSSTSQGQSNGIIPKPAPPTPDPSALEEISEYQSILASLFA